MEFENWWNRNKDLYSLVNVTKEIAKAIWTDAYVQSRLQPTFIKNKY